MRRWIPYLVLVLLIAAPLVSAHLSVVEAGPPLQDGGDEGEVPLTPQTDFATFVINTRLDLELLADTVNGPGARPVGWNGTIDPADTGILGDLWLDIEAQADIMIEAEGARPRNWLGATSPTPLLIARNLRHDLELLADLAFGEDERPDEWLGALEIFRCSQSLQNLVASVTGLFGYELTTSSAAFNYCGAVAQDVAEFITRQGILTTLEQDVPQLLDNIRGDLERLADEINGLGVRPDGWRRTRTLDSNLMTQDLLFDLTLLADDKLGTGQRPPGWVGDVSPNLSLSAGNLRSDLELLADTLLAGRETDRPFGWLGLEGFSNVALCNLDVQNLAVILTNNFGYEIPTISAPDDEAYCRALEGELNVFAEAEPEPGDGTGEGLGASGRPVAEADYAFAYLDVGALQFMGIVPRGVEFEAWYRNFGESPMMYIVGADFAVYISYEWSTLEETTFLALPSLEGIIPETFCFAEWCTGPGPTPTPTGQAPTPTPGAAPGEPPPGFDDLQLVPWNQIIVFYDQDTENNTAFVRLELCPDASGTSCEPVQNVYNEFGQPLSIVNILGPYPVFEIPYGYSNAFVLQSPSYYANEVWISDPTLRGVQSN